MKGIVVSAHGGIFQTNASTTTIPSGSEVNYYVKEKEILPDSNGHEVLYAFQSNEIPATPIAEKIAENQTTNNYACWMAMEFGAACGIFEVGTTRRLNDLTSYGEESPYYLDQILKDYPDVPVYWACSRDVIGSDPRQS